MTPPLLQRGDGSFTGMSRSGRAYGPILRVATVAAYVQQHGGGDFTSPRDSAGPNWPSVSLLPCPVGTRRCGGGCPPGGCAAAALRLQWLGVLLSWRPVGYRLWRWRLFPPAWL